MSVIIRYKKIKDGNLSPYLDIHFRGIRRYEYLNIKIKQRANTPLERAAKREKEDFVKRVANEREREILTNQFQLDPVRNTEIDFFLFFQNFIDNCPNKDIRAFKAVLKRMKSFTKKSTLYCHEISEGLIQKVINHFYDDLNGVTPINYAKKLRQVINEARKQKYIIGDPFNDVVFKPRFSNIKDVLTTQELNILFAKPCGNIEVKRAFLLSCLTGLRFCDLKELKWNCIKNGFLEFTQKKTGLVNLIPLNAEAKSILQNRKAEEDFVFKLPSHTACLKNLKLWVKKAEINRHITLHCGRHTFGTSLINSGVDIYTVSKLLGHSSIRHTTVYLRYNDKLASAAVLKLPKIFSK